MTLRDERNLIRSNIPPIADQETARRSPVVSLVLLCRRIPPPPPSYKTRLEISESNISPHTKRHKGTTRPVQPSPVRHKIARNRPCSAHTPA